jgi:hypothetical protein
MRHGHGAFDVLCGDIRGLPQQRNDPVFGWISTAHDSVANERERLVN